MKTPRFEEHLTSTPGAEPGEAFQTFVYDLLRDDYLGLHPFESRGKDGGIDLIQTTAKPERVIECKYIGEDDIAEAKKRWKVVKKHLSDNATDPSGPKESQYAPWYRTDPCIKHYVFCVSSLLKNQANFFELQQTIEQDFRELAGYAHLKHLADIEVEVLDWSDFSTRLQAQSYQLFRWFKGAIPSGLVHLERPASAGKFSAFLSSAFYSRKDHFDYLGTSPTAAIPDEDVMLQQLNDGSLTGLIITGKGGFGKTRLTLELGKLAASKGWIVLRVGKSCKDDDLELLAKRLSPADKVLLLIDYVETLPNFASLTNKLYELNDEFGYQLRYLANCRKSYYLSSIAKEYWQAELDLSKDEVTPGTTPALKEWFELYRRRVVVHILDQCGVADSDLYLNICRDIPVFAVFVAYLHSQGREKDLRELLAENNFRTWLTKRVQMTFGAQADSADLATLMALFPFPVEVLEHPALAIYREPLNRLYKDGWIERFFDQEYDNLETVRVAHDVLADQILLNHFEKSALTAKPFVHSLFALGREIGCLDSVLFALQRLATQPLIQSFDWPAIFDREVANPTAAWLELRNWLIRTPLLTEPQRIELLAEHESFWEDAELDPDFQEALGTLVRWASKEGESFADLSHYSTLRGYLCKAAPHVLKNNFLLRQGIFFAPQAIKEYAFEWISNHAWSQKNQFLLNAWLTNGLPPDEIAFAVRYWANAFSHTKQFSYVASSWLRATGKTDTALVEAPLGEWLAAHKLLPEASHVYNAWLDATKDRALVEAPLGEWLAAHKLLPEASHVYKAWLDATKDRALVEAPLGEWLAAHKLLPEASHVYNAWLDATKDRALVEAPLWEWLRLHELHPEAGYVYRAWLENGFEFEAIQDSVVKWLGQNYQPEDAVFVIKYLVKLPVLPTETIKQILWWCQLFPQNEDVLWRFSGLRKKLLVRLLAAEVCKTVETVIPTVLRKASRLDNDTVGQINQIFSFLCTHDSFLSGDLRQRSDEVLAQWVRHPAAYNDRETTHSFLQRAEYFQRVTELLKSGSLILPQDRAYLFRFFRWVNRWTPENKEAVGWIIELHRDNYPDPELWDIIEILSE